MAIMGSSPTATATAAANNAHYAQFRTGTATTSPEFCAVILAATHGANLFPLTAPCGSSEEKNKLLLPPKHLLHLAGVPLLHRLITSLQTAGGFTNFVVCIAHDDDVTIPSLTKQEGEEGMEKGSWKIVEDSSSSTGADDNTAPGAALDDPTTDSRKSTVVFLEQSYDSNTSTAATDGGHGQHGQQQQQKQRLVIVRLEEGDTAGSVHALRQVEETNVISKHSHIVVFPSDLVILNGVTAIQQLVHAHREQQQQSHSFSSSGGGLHNSNNNRQNSSSPPLAAAACTVLLTDVGEVDENGIPLKESAKQKKGGLAREDEEIEYTALAYYNNTGGSSSTPRLVWKQSKFDVEQDEHFTGDAPKLVLPKPRLRLSGGDGVMNVKVQTSWNDVHVYVLAPWVRRLITTRTTSLLSIQADLIPLLVSRQFKGIAATFGSKMDRNKVYEILRNHGGVGVGGDTNSGVVESPPSSRPLPQGGMTRASSTSSSPEKQQAMAPSWLSSEYAVLAHVVPGSAAVRANSIPAFLYASKELVSQAVQATTTTTATSRNPCLFLPPNSSVRAKFQSIILADSTLGEKITFKSSIVGRHCKLGSKCRLNNVILLDGVTLGDNVILQNSIIGPQAVIHDNCSLNDCQVAPSRVVASGTKQKSEALLLDDDDVDRYGGQDDLAIAGSSSM